MVAEAVAMPVVVAEVAVVAKVVEGGIIRTTITIPPRTNQSLPMLRLLQLSVLWLMPNSQLLQRRVSLRIPSRFRAGLLSQRQWRKPHRSLQPLLSQRCGLLIARVLST